MLPRFLQEVCASGHYVSHRTDNGVLICDASCERSNPGPPLPPPGGLGLDFVSQTFSPRLWRCSGSLTLLGRGSCEASHSSIHPSAWKKSNSTKFAVARSSSRSPLGVALSPDYSRR